MRNIAYCIITGFVFCLLPRCGGEEEEFQKIERSLTVSETALVKADNSFAFKLFKEINEQEGEKGDNIFISPYSVAMALGMLYNGADGSTREEMESMLELSGMTLQEVNESYRGLMEYLTHQDSKVALEIANSIWYRNGFPVKQSFVDANQDYFDALVRGLDFSATDAAETINAWVDEKTHGKIEEIVDDPIAGGVVMFLINAVYFKGSWKYEFNKERTRDALFSPGDGDAITCPTMSQEEEFRFAYTEDFQAIDLPYGDAGFTMTVFLPSNNSNVDALIGQLNEENWSLWMGLLLKTDVSFHFPKFKVEYKIKLNDVLKSLGMEEAFTEGADFSEMCDGASPYVSEVRHKTYVDVDEEGTEAAAVTSITMDVSSAGLEMRVNRPFLFVIRESTSGAILFMGKIVDPTAG